MSQKHLVWVLKCHRLKEDGNNSVNWVWAWSEDVCNFALLILFNGYCFVVSNNCRSQSNEG